MKTPNLDRPAREGTGLQPFTVCNPVCSTNPAHAGRRFKNVGRNGDGKLTREESAGPPGKIGAE